MTGELDLDDLRTSLESACDANADMWVDGPTALTLLDQLETAKRACRTLGGVIDHQCTSIVEITRSEHLLDETGDGDWETVWSRGYEMRDQLDHERDRAQHAEIQVGLMTERAEAAEARAEAAVSSLAREIATTSTRTYEHTRGSVDILVQLLAEAQIRGAFARAEAAEADRDKWVGIATGLAAHIARPEGHKKPISDEGLKTIRAALKGPSDE